MSKYIDHWHYLIFYSLKREARRGINYFSFPLKSSKDVLKAEKIMWEIFRNQGCDIPMAICSFQELECDWGGK